tara:strand:- start:8222 stop:9517 length:1296 start_codon:yes stop_codon:yes gene_type:complete
MKIKLKQRILSENNKKWGKIVGVTGAGQLVVQISALIIGLLIVRFLSPEEYAFYTIANAMLGTMTVLADGGISAGVLAEGGKVWEDRIALGKVLATGLALRRKFALYSLIFCIPALSYLLWKQDAAWWQIVIISLSLIPAFYAALSDSILEIVPKLHYHVKPLQKNQVVVNILRLISSLVIFLVPFTVIALLANGIPRIIGNFRLRKIVSPYADFDQSIDNETKGAILKVVKGILPGSIYFCFSGQISVWLISIFGETTAVAQIGALGRFSMILNFVTMVAGMLLIPAFAKYKGSNSKVLVFFTFSLLGGMVLTALFSFIFYLFSSQALWLLGDKYENLNYELVLVIIAAALSVTSGVLFKLSSSRGKPTHPLLIIFGNLSFIVVGVLIFDISNLVGVLYFNIFINSMTILVHAISFYYNFYYKNLKTDVG